MHQLEFGGHMRRAVHLSGASWMGHVCLLFFIVLKSANLSCLMYSCIFSIA